MLMKKHIKVIFVVLATMATLTAHAYGDHRNRKVDSLETVLLSNHPPKGEQLLRTYLDLMNGYLQTDGKKATHYAQKALALTYKLNALNARADALRILGLLAYGGNDYEQALAFFDHALAVTDSMRNDRRYKQADIDDNLSALYGSIANVYNMQDRLHLAIAYYQKALPIFEKHHWMESTTILYHNVGELYQSMGNDTEAERNYLKAVEAAKETNDSLLIAVPHKGLAKIYIGRGNYEKAKEAADICYEYYSRHAEEERGDYIETLVSEARIARDGHNDMPQAEAYTEEALALANDEVVSETLAALYSLCCETAMQQRQWQTALDFCLRAVNADTTETYSDIGNYVQLAQIYTELGNKEKAKEYAAKTYSAAERFATEHYQSGLSQMAVLYETEKKQDAIEQLKRQRRWYVWGASLACGILLLTALLFFLLWRAVRLSKKTALFKAKLDGEQAERKRLADDLHDGLGGMLSLLRMKLENDAPKDDTLRLLESTVGELRHVAHHLMPEELLQGGLKSALSDLAISVPGVQFHYFGNEQRLPQDAELVLYRCAYEMLNNALKHASAQRIDIQLVQRDELVSLTVCDDGRGFDQDTPPTGIGLQNIRNRIAHYKGKMNIVSSEEKGTEINVTLPL